MPHPAPLVLHPYPPLLAEPFRTVMRTAVVVLSSGLDSQSRRNAWTATSEGAARARARREADSAMRAARLRDGASVGPEARTAT